MSRKKEISEEDRKLFRDAVGQVRPVEDDRRPLDAPNPKARPHQSEQDDKAVMRELMSDFSENDLLDTGEHLSHAIAGVQRSVLRNLKSGKYAIQGEIDLHGFSRDQAMEALGRFLQEQIDARHTCVRIIHGKGRRNSDSEPVLKRVVAAALQRNRRVLAFCSARENDGGTGALYVLLRKFSG